MASNFKIIRHHNSDNLHLNLVGDFDGSAAMELVHVIEDNVARFQRIFVHTCGLSSLLPFGESAFIRNIKVSWLRSRQLIFTGNYGRDIADRPDTKSKTEERPFTTNHVMYHTA